MLRLKRSIKQYQGGVPEAIAAGSTAQVVYALSDSRADVLALHAALSEAIEALEECADYFDNRADADCDQYGFIPNTEMRLLSTVRDAISKAGVL